MNRTLALLAFVVSGIAPLQQLQSQQARKVYISVDMEGISGVNSDNQTSAAGAEYGRARKLMVEDANGTVFPS